MKIYIETTIGLAETYKIEVESSTTIQQLKQLFLEKLDDTSNFESIYFVFKELKVDHNEKTLLDYNITDKSILQVINIDIKSRNELGFIGAEFADLSNEKGLKKHEWAKTAPSWRRAVLGLCLEGTCTNDQCQASKQRIIMGIGYKRFDILVDPDENTTICPVCKKYVEPETCSFNNCWWKYEGTKLNTNENNKMPIKCSSDWQYADNAYHYFDEKTSGKIIWKRLIVEAVKDKP